jgi:predicted nuclease of restriction endonuclease-like (RecB) superfamily
MIMLYWDLGKQITEKQENAKWGSGFIEQLSKDLREEFPEMTGFSRANLFRMKKFYQFYAPAIQCNEFIPQLVGQLENTGTQIVAQLVRQLQTPDNQPNINMEQLVPKLLSIPWGHNVSIIEQVKDLNQALFYINKTIENNWSRAVLEYQIESNLYDRQGKAVTNFSLTLPTPQSDLANEMMKDPYNFDFLRLSEKVKEIDLEKALVQHISQFLPELGLGFAYMGRQFMLKVGEDDYRTDLLFYHTRLKCYVIIELKTKKFEPEFVGKLNFYITAVNELVKDTHDKPTIGMLLCKNKNNYAVEFSLKDINNPIGVSTFHYTELTDEMKVALPSAEELQNELLNFERKHGKI